VDLHNNKTTYMVGKLPTIYWKKNKREFQKPEA